MSGTEDDSKRWGAIGHQQIALQILKDAPVVILVLDLEGRIQHVNSFFERLAGYRLDEVRGRDWFDTFLPERDRERIRALFRQSREGEHVDGSVNAIVTRAGDERQIEWTDEFLRDNEGRAIGIVAIGQDVTERSAARDALRTSEQRLAEAQRIASLGAWELDLRTLTPWWSEEQYRLNGVPLGTPVSQDQFLSMIHPDDRAKFAETFRTALEAGAWEGEYRIVRPDGQVRTLYGRAKTTCDARGTPVKIAGTNRDITDSKNTEDAARRNDALLRTVIGGAPVVIFALDRQGVFRFSEGRALANLGLRPGQIVGTSALDVYGSVPGFEETFRRALSGEQSTLTSHFGPIAFEAAYAPSYDADGVIDGVIGVGFDVTDRLTAEAVVREREARLALVFNHTSDTMLLLSVDADGTLRVAAANRSFVDRISMITKVDEADLIGLTLEELTLEIYRRPPAVLAQYQESLRRAIDTRTPVTFEHSMIFPTGPIFTEVMLVPVLDGAGACVQVLWSSRDVTARKQADAQVRASLGEKETLLREIHHRVKNNLQVIAGLLHFQSKKLRAPEDVAAFAELRQRIFAMTLLHERLYQSSDVARVIFCDYVRALVAELGRSFAPRQGIRIEVKTTNDVLLPLEIAMPSGMIVTELVTNVFKHAFPGTREGTATVSVRTVGDRIVLGVDDDGVGFPDGLIPGAGSSFGWELVRSLVLQLDGTVEATTDRGAHVRVSFAAPALAEGPPA